MNALEVLDKGTATYSSPIRLQKGNDCARYADACIVEGLVRRPISIAYWNARMFEEEIRKYRRPYYDAHGSSPKYVLENFRILFEEELEMPDEFRSWAIETLGNSYSDETNEKILDHLVTHFRTHFDPGRSAPLEKFIWRLSAIAKKTAGISDEIVRGLKDAFLKQDGITLAKSGLRNGIPSTVSIRGDYSSWFDQNGHLIKGYPAPPTMGERHAVAVIAFETTSEKTMFTLQNSHGVSSQGGGWLKIPESALTDFATLIDVYVGRKIDFSQDVAHLLSKAKPCEGKF